MHNMNKHKKFDKHHENEVFQPFPAQPKIFLQWKSFTGRKEYFGRLVPSHSKPKWSLSDTKPRSKFVCSIYLESLGRSVKILLILWLPGYNWKETSSTTSKTGFERMGGVRLLSSNEEQFDSESLQQRRSFMHPLKRVLPFFKWIELPIFAFHS